MATNLNLDDKLIEAARKAGKHRTKKDAVTAALREYVKMRGRRELIQSFGTVEFWPDYDPKKLRAMKSTRAIKPMPRRKSA